MRFLVQSAEDIITEERVVQFSFEVESGGTYR